MDLEQRLSKLTKETYGHGIAACTDVELYYSILQLCKEHIAKRPALSGNKKLYYISMEFLIGKLLSNHLINLGIYEDIKQILTENGRHLEEVFEAEPEPSLGNGGLGRLAACFLDSIATLGLPGDGMGLLYHFGLFRQVFRENMQTEEVNEWIQDKGWLHKTENCFQISLGEEQVIAEEYFLNIVGYDGGVNKLHLFDLKGVDEHLVQAGISFDKKRIDKNLTLFLYPDDSDEAGNLLRICQEYFLVACSARFILQEMKSKQFDLHHLDRHAVIQINDTHPSMIIPELIRLLTAEEGFTMEEAIAVVRKTCAYTNHTILAEALEKWPITLLKKVVPHLLPIIEELDRRVKEQYSDASVQIIDRGHLVHMANMDIHYGFSVNGVAAIHTDILKKVELAPFYQLYPDKFHNVTNGISFRRWLLVCNPELSNYLTHLIGPGVARDAGKLLKLLDYKTDRKVLEQLTGIKQWKKEQLTEYIKEREDILLPTDAIFDIQIKRLHEYKRQQMNALYVIHKYLEIKSGKKPLRPIVFLFGAKAAPAYQTAKDIIHLLLVLEELIRQDTEVNPYIRLIMVENYNVSYAEKLIPACDISEQISLASKEASGTGNMKLMLNGAVTLGTLDGANVEIHRLVGDENIYLFGDDSETVIARYREKTYHPMDYYKKDPFVKRAIDFIDGEELMAIGHKECLRRLKKEILHKDYFMTLPDFSDYVRVKEQAFSDYENRELWSQKMLVNIAKAGYFSADRAIAEYNREIWSIGEV